MGCRVAIMLVAGFINIRAAFISDTRPNSTQEKYKDKSSFFFKFFFLIFFWLQKSNQLQFKKSFYREYFYLNSEHNFILNNNQQIKNEAFEKFLYFSFQENLSENPDDCVFSQGKNTKMKRIKNNLLTLIIF